MDEILNQLRAQMQDLDHSQRQMLREVDQMKVNMEKAIDNLRDETVRSIGSLRNAVTTTNAAVTAVGGTFAGIEVILREIERWRASIEARMDAIEKQRPPAA